MKDSIQNLQKQKKHAIIILIIINKEEQNMNENVELVYFGYESELDYDFTPDYDEE